MLNLENIPKHVAIIMDGNGRWAKKRHIPRLSGHYAGMKSMREIVRCSSEIGVGYLTVYAFSTENWKRSSEEVSGIFKLLIKFVDSDLKELNQENVKIAVFGDYKKIPEAAKKSIERAMEETKDNTGLQLNIALNYGGRADILKAVNKIKEQFLEGSLEGEITEEMISNNLFSGQINGNVPDPDLIIRTSGEQRLSNFLLWQCAYSEFAFVDEYWPDFTPEIYKKVIEDYQNRDRRFGGRR